MSRSLLAAVLAAGALLALPVAAQATSPDVVISQVYGGGGNSGATYRNDFIELFNRGSAPVSVDGWSVRYASSAGTTWQQTDIAGTIPAGGYYLVREGAGAGGTQDLPEPVDAGGGIAMSGTSGKVALLTDRLLMPACGSAGNSCLPSARIRDYVGYGTAAQDSETAPTATLSNTTAAIRGDAGCRETDNNAFDFGTGAPAPRNSATDLAPCAGPPADAAPSVAGTNPDDGQFGVSPDSSITVTFSEPVTAAGAFALSCSDARDYAVTVSTSDQTTFAIVPAESLPRGESCTLTIDDESVRDVDLVDPPDTMAADDSVTFFIAGLEGLRIHDIQSTRHRSPYEDNTVAAVPGVVTAFNNLGFWMQDTLPDRDRRTSEGIFVFRGGRPVIGTAVLVDGRVEEFRPGGDPNNLTTTEISNPTVSETGTGSVAPTLLGRGGLRPPLRFIDNDSNGDVELNPIFDPWQDGIDFHESLEGMWVEIRRPEVVGPTSGFDELPVVSDGAARPRTNRDGVIVTRTDFNPERFILDDGMAEPPDANVGDGLTRPVRAIVDYSFGNFKYLLTASPARIDRGLKPEVTKAPKRDELATGSMNVENLSPNDTAAKYERLARILVQNMRSPDLVALEEIQDNDGATGGVASPETDATLTWERFIATVEAVGGPTYEFRQIDPVDDQDGGQPGGNIRVGFLFKTDRGLEFVDRPGGTSINSTEVVDGASGPELTLSPGRLDPLNTAFANSRKPLAGEFRWRGETVFAVANHFNSKGGDQPLFGRFQPPQRVTEEQRHKQATVLRDFVRQALKVDRDVRVVVLGDLNDFEFSRTLDIVESAPMTNLMETLDSDERYSYVFEGNSQTLDQILVTRSLRRGAEYDSVHVNAEFFDQASDHDPQVARLEVDEKHGHGHHHGDHDEDDDD